MVPYSFTHPSSPHLASKKDGKMVKTEKIIDSFHVLKNAFDIVIVEGSGGLMVPLDEGNLFCDLVASIKMPVIVVSDNRLGAINQTLLTVKALQSIPCDLFWFLKLYLLYLAIWSTQDNLT